MTLIVGIKCDDGVVVGADGAATLGSLGQYTARQAVKKLHNIDNSMIVAVSGHVGLGQRIVGTLDQLWTSKAFVGKESFNAVTIMREELFKHISIEMKIAAEAARVVGPAAAQSSALTATVVATPIKKKACLFQFDQQCAPEEATFD